MKAVRFALPLCLWAATLCLVVTNKLNESFNQ